MANNSETPTLELHGSGSNDSPIKLLRMKQVQEKTGLSRSYLYDLSNRGLFPASVPLIPGGAAKAWVETEINDWINSRIAARQEVHNA